MSRLARVEDERRGDVVIASLHGEVDTSNATAIGNRLRALLTNRSDALAIDLRETTYLDSAGVAMLFGLEGELRLHQQELHLVVAPGASVARILDITGLGAVARVHADVEAALAAIGGGDG